LLRQEVAARKTFGGKKGREEGRAQIRPMCGGKNGSRKTTNHVMEKAKKTGVKVIKRKEWTESHRYQVLGPKGEPFAERREVPSRTKKK